MAGLDRAGWWLSALVTAMFLMVAGCSTSTPASSSGQKLEVVATINAWGSIAAQLGGDKVHETSIISNPNVDPHAYEPSTADARTIAEARVVVTNGVGYDAWIGKLLDADPNPHRTALTVGDIVGVAKDGNPHQWYSPEAVAKVIDAITAAYQQADPADAAYFAQQKQNFLNQGLAKYHALISDIENTYPGTPIGASESIVSPLANALGLSLITPADFLKAISEGTDPSPADKATVDAQIASKAMAVYIYNSQNSTPDVRAQIDAARKQGIAVTTVTETLAPEGVSFQDWQSAQLSALKDALHTATGK